jgi:hypothetical protein
MKFDTALKIINENYSNYDSAVFKMKCIIRSLRKTYDDDTIIMAFQDAMKKKFKK